ncbi:hypothetical protein C0Z18_15195 [Trinickia dabaoshanensis]|uniref:Pentapeptide repeat-containing protein n=1 Tax=Trinickia dabaoshanensis TaxID=564714 RepID=A0A2N7VPU4_9BURK|nr:pentapeptide repeat-containing protein [Trinickia dabaoshanensis]PMS19152.1 hypothetical protein C0Z18_15195 [Trinickia dabaoshanensis]
MTSSNLPPKAKPGSQQPTSANGNSAGKQARTRPTANPNILTKYVSGKRKSSYWDPLYSESFRGIDRAFDWDISNVTGISYSECTAERLSIFVNKKKLTRWSAKGFSFENCDFRGNFISVDLSFNSCQFLECDLGSATWKGVKFSNCKFSRVSLSLATFEQCQFIDCIWSEIGVSGTETKFFDSMISNPWEFVMSAYTNMDAGVLLQKGPTSPAHQRMRLEETKVKMARAVLSNNERNADDNVYYQAVKTYLTQSLISRRESAKFVLRSKDHPPTKESKAKPLKKVSSLWKVLQASLELSILKISGAVNEWGYSLARPALVGLMMIALFAVIYKQAGVTCDAPDVIGACTWKLAFMTSFDVSLLVGYTKHAAEKTLWIPQVIYGINAIFGLWWYAIFVPTVINRISRVR